MIRVVSITFALVLVTIGGGISLSNAHGSAGKAALSSQDMFEAGDALREQLVAPMQPILRSGSVEANNIADVVTKDVTRADGFQWRTFGPSLAPQRGMRPKSRFDRQTQTAQITAPTALNPPTLNPVTNLANSSVPRTHKTDARAETPRPVPAVKRRDMRSDPNPGFLIGVFR